MLLQLTEQEMLEAGLIGLQRTIQSRVQGLSRAKHGVVPNEWEIDVLGAMAEKALAKALGIYYTPGINTFHAPDVGDLPSPAPSAPRASSFSGRAMRPARICSSSLSRRSSRLPAFINSRAGEILLTGPRLTRSAPAAGPSRRTV